MTFFELVDSIKAFILVLNIKLKHTKYIMATHKYVLL